MNTLHDRGLTPPEPVDAPEAPADSPWVMTAEGLRKFVERVCNNHFSSVIASAVPIILRALCDRFEDDQTALHVPGFCNNTPGAVQAWYLPNSVTVVDLDGNLIDCDRLEEWENGTLQARWAEDAAEDAMLRDL